MDTETKWTHEQAIPLASGKEDINGLTIYWEKHGTGDHVVLCLPGLLGSVSWNYHPVFKKANLTKFTYVGIDPQGFGKSRPPDREHSPHVYPLLRDAEIAVKVMEILGYSKYSVMGWSNGSISGMLIAGLFPERVCRVVVVNPVLNFNEFVQEVMKGMSNLKTWPKEDAEIILEMYGEEYFKRTITEWVRWLHAFPKRTDGGINIISETLKKIQAPVLFVHGQRDRYCNDVDRRILQDNIRNLRMREAPGGMHSQLSFVDPLVALAESFFTE